VGTIADTIRAEIAAGKTNDEVLDAVKAAHPGSNTTPACVSYYRSKMKKAGTATAPRENPYKEATVSHALFKALNGPSDRVYTVKNVKSFRGNEGYGFNATLYRGDKRVALVMDDANGGCYSYEWYGDASARKAEADMFTATAKQLYPDETFEVEDRAVARLVDDVLLLKDAAKATKGKVAIIKDGKLYTIKAPNGVVTPAFIELVRQKNGNPTILNGKDDVFVLAALRAIS
jgi:quinol monooxygenase YgiN